MLIGLSVFTGSTVTLTLHSTLSAVENECLEGLRSRMTFVRSSSIVRAGGDVNGKVSVKDGLSQVTSDYGRSNTLKVNSD